MSGLLFLSSEDFSVEKGQKGPVLVNGIPGFSLILFYSTHCTHCQSLIPIFKSLPGTIGGCQFGMINISSNRPVVDMSQETISPIKFVPLIILYIQGKPFMMYKGPYDQGEITRFVVEIAKNVQQKQQFSKEKVKEDPEGGGIPAYTIGKPVSGDKNNQVCWLDFKTAYDKK